MAKQKEIEIGGKKYLLQNPGALWYTRLSDRCANRNGVLVRETYFGEMLKNVVVEPKNLTISDFDENFGDFEELMGEIEVFLRAK